MAEADYDLAIIGGGINGAGIARDAAGRGLRVLLVEQGDLAGGTSSASSKLIHGGLRYLEQGAFRLVREALAERAVLWRIAPHLVHPMRFVLPHNPALRPGWMIGVGLWLYDHLAPHRILPRARRLVLAQDEAGAALKPQFRTASEYSDCAVNDARLTVLNAVDAAERGASIRTRCRCTAARRGALWTLDLDDRGTARTVTARVLVDAAGAWTNRVAAEVIGTPLAAPLRLVKGSHILVPRLFTHDKAYLLQNADRRVVFAIPFEGNWTLIGTTDSEFTGDPAVVAPSAEEIAYLCDAANAYFATPVAPADVVYAFAGVRALDASETGRAQDANRDYALTLDAPGPEAAPLLTVRGGKLTTYRKLAEAALVHLGAVLPIGTPWTADAPLPGGEFPFDMFDGVVAQAHRSWPFAGDRMIHRLVSAYGERIGRILGDATSMDDLGACLFGDFTQAELTYLMQHEFAVTPDDVLWRRSHLGLQAPGTAKGDLARLMNRQAAA